MPCIQYISYRISYSMLHSISHSISYMYHSNFCLFSSVRGEPVIDEIYYLQGYKGGWTKWEEKMNITECNDRTGFVQVC